ncbi:hypothetical protein NGA_0482400 [Nannochloropsis gaditana CCMP526]|nr:hypothetical protein NGA_0482400 [Nannochloropsis gaditana CCMP526]EKU22693.1 hypothetical protein NGA_0482400 [Nannochloropsis gaditana CCMP526]|eukprot:XP_005853669.1 hypothetical protein NGA_0482400 [Nannochloropsis gaditana CCMP526]
MRSFFYLLYLCIFFVVASINAFVPSTPAPVPFPSTSSLTRNAQMLGRRHGRVLTQAKKRGGAASGPQSVTGESLRGFTKVLDVGSELADAEGSQKAVGPLKDDKFLLLIRRKEGRVSAIDANCGRCKFPLLKGKVSEDPSVEDDEDKGIITCPLCAVRFSLASGLVTGAQADNVLQRVSASFFSKQIASGLKTYAAAAGTDGSVYAKLR